MKVRNAKASQVDLSAPLRPPQASGPHWTGRTFTHRRGTLEFGSAVGEVVGGRLPAHWLQLMGGKRNPDSLRSGSQQEGPTPDSSLCKTETSKGSRPRQTPAAPGPELDLLSLTEQQVRVRHHQGWSPGPCPGCAEAQDRPSSLGAPVSGTQGPELHFLLPLWWLWSQALCTFIF